MWMHVHVLVSHDRLLSITIIVHVHIPDIVYTLYKSTLIILYSAKVMLCAPYTLFV